MKKHYYLIPFLALFCATPFALPIDVQPKVTNSVSSEEEEEDEGTTLENSIDEGVCLDSTNNAVFSAVTLSNGVVIPAANLYNHWCNDRVNPYNVRLVEMADTFKIDMTPYVHPILQRITSNFGLRRGRYHYGIDLKLYTGDTVRCSFDGVVRIALRGRGYGKFVVVRHNNGLETTYAHLSKIIAPLNDSIKAGDPIGLGGNTGRSTGSHLHYEVRYLGNPIDPNLLIDFSVGKPMGEQFLISANTFEYVKEAEKVRLWTVRKGDTLGRIAQRTGVPIQTICRLNGISSRSILRVGRQIRYN